MNIESPFNIDQDEVHIWTVALSNVESRREEYLALLSALEQGKAARFRHVADSDRYIGSHAVLRQILALYLGIPVFTAEFELGRHGKPRLPGGVNSMPLSFNLSHSGSWALIGITRRRPIGVDVERIRPDIDAPSLVAQVVAPEDGPAILAMKHRDLTRVFYRCWTHKEACLKASGTGLAADSDLVVTALAADHSSILLTDRRRKDRAVCWTAYEVAVDHGYAAAAVVEGKGLKFTVRSWASPKQA